MKNKEKESRLQKSSLKDFRKMRKEQESMIQMFNHKFHSFYFCQFLVPKLVQSYQGDCGINLKASDNENYLALKSHRSTTFTINGEENTRSDIWYVHFNNICLKEYAYLKHNTRYNQSPLNLITIHKNTLLRLSHEDEQFDKLWNHYTWQVNTLTFKLKGVMFLIIRSVFVKFNQRTLGVKCSDNWHIPFQLLEIFDLLSARLSLELL